MKGPGIESRPSSGNNEKSESRIAKIRCRSRLLSQQTFFNAVQQQQQQKKQKHKVQQLGMATKQGAQGRTGG